MNNFKIKTIDVQAKEWFDKANANSYFSAIITLNHGLEDAKFINIPFQYGYDSAYEYTALHQLNCEGYINATSKMEFRDYCEANGIIVRFSKKENCLKSEVKNWAY